MGDTIGFIRINEAEKYFQTIAAKMHAEALCGAERHIVKINKLQQQPPPQQQHK